MNERPVSRPGIASPCVRNCCLDDDDVCLGCGRAIAEIVGWSRATDSERDGILSRSRERMAQRDRSHR